jgi:hypothetical protein
MWQTNSLWFEVAIVSMVYALGHIFFGHFEERTPSSRKFTKYVVTMIIILGLSIWLGRTVAMVFLSLWIIPLVYIHGIYLPKKGINGWTAKPRSKYYEFRKWDKDIFKEEG